MQKIARQNAESEIARTGKPNSTLIPKKFETRDFVVGTTTAVHAHVSPDGTEVKVLNRDHDAAVHALASHPNK